MKYWKEYVFVLFAIFVNGCIDHPEPVRQDGITLDTEVDLLDRLITKHAEVNGEFKEHVYQVFTEIDNQPKWGIFQHSSSEIVFDDVYIGKNSELQFDIGMLSRVWEENRESGNPCGDGVRFQISVRSGEDAEKIIYSRYINPKVNEQERQWISESVTVAGIEDVTATIAFKVLPGETNEDVNRDCDYAVWGNPKLVSTGRTETHRDSELPNILLITLDTTRADYLSPYGNEWIQNPAISRLANEGILFERAFTPMATTSPAHASILTSMFPYQHGVISNKYHLADAIPRLPQILKEFGYETGAAVSVFHLSRNISGLGRWFAEEHYSQLEERLEENLSFDRLTRPGSSTTSAAIDLMEEFHNQPFFLWVHYYDAHAPYKAVSEYHRMYYEGNPMDSVHQSMKNLIKPDNWGPEQIDWVLPFTDLEYFKKEYGAEISYTDAQIQRLLQALQRLQVGDNTIVILTADHGENIGDHDIYFDHWTTFESDIHVPLIIHYPRELPQGVRISQDVSLVDVSPTILDLIGATGYDLADSFQGQSLKPLWTGEGDWEERFMVAEGLLYQQIAVWKEQYKLRWELRRRRYHEKSQLFPDQVVLYDLSKDPEELNPIGRFYWRNPEDKMIGVDWNPLEKLSTEIDESKIRNLIESTRERLCNKVVPTAEELKAWFEENNGVDYLEAEYLGNPEYLQLVVDFMVKAKEHACPPALHEIVKPDWVMSEYDALNLNSTAYDDPAFTELMKSLGYTSD